MRSNDWDRFATDVEEFLAAQPASTLADISDGTGLSMDQVRGAIKHHRTENVGGQFGIVANPVSWDTWVYDLTSDPDALHEYTNRRLTGDSRTRMVTLHGTAEAAVQATDGRTTPGRVARAYELHTRRLLEDLERIDDGLV